MTLLTHLPADERLQWKFALLNHRPHDRPGRHMATFVLGAMHQAATGGDATMPEHWAQAVLDWRSRGFGPHTYLVLHHAVADLARLGYQVPVPPPGPVGLTSDGRARIGGAEEPSGPVTGAEIVPAPAPARRAPRRYRSWGGRPGPGPYALAPDEWAGTGDWIASAVREIALDVLTARDGA